MKSNVLQFTGAPSKDAKLAALYQQMYDAMTPVGILSGIEKKYTNIELRQVVMTFTPTIAKLILDATEDEGQRAVSIPIVREYEIPFKEGKWVVNGEGIIFSDTWVLCNGRHRLTTCVRTDIPFTTTVLWGVDESVFSTIDSGKKRNGKDWCDIAGEKYSGILSTAINLHIRYMRGNMRKQHKPTAQQTNDFLNMPDANPMRDSVAFVKKIKGLGTSGPLSSGQAAFIHYHASYYHRAKADEFIQKIASGEGLYEGDAILTLRNRLLDPMYTKGKNKADVPAKIAWVINAWNHYILDKDMPRIKGETAKKNRSENFPRFSDPEEDSRAGWRFKNSGWKIRQTMQPLAA